MEGKLFPELPEDITALSDDELESLLGEHLQAAELINADDEKFLGDLDANEIIAQYEAGANQIQLLRDESGKRVEAHEAYQARKEEIKAELNGAPAVEKTEESEEALEVVAEAEAITEEAVEEEASEKEPELVTAAAEPVQVARYSRRPPAPTPEREPQAAETPKGVALVAAGEMGLQYPGPLDPQRLGALVRDAAVHHGPHPKVDPPGKYRFGGPEHKIARAVLDFPEDRELTDDWQANQRKIAEVVPAYIPGGIGKRQGEALVASGGLCAPAENFYGMVNFATDDEPVWDALPVYAARRGAINVPESTYIGDITSAISSISVANDALGGTFATKSCQDLDCVDYTPTQVNIIAHCREYGNLNARSWPEKIAHENELTMAALARTSEMFILERIKALSVNVTSGAATLSALTYLVDAIVKSQFGIRSRFRMPTGARFRALLPAVILDMLLVDAVQNAFDRYKTRGELDSFLRSVGIDPVYYIDGDFAAGDDMVADAAQGAGALESWPNTFQWALYPEGAFLGIDMGTLELGIVRDSELNATNDFQIFGERFRNVARIAPQQACYWETTTLCAVGTFPPAGTARTCES